MAGYFDGTPITIPDSGGGGSFDFDAEFDARFDARFNAAFDARFAASFDAAFEVAFGAAIGVRSAWDIGLSLQYMQYVDKEYITVTGIEGCLEWYF